MFLTRNSYDIYAFSNQNELCNVQESSSSGFQNTLKEFSARFGEVGATPLPLRESCVKVVVSQSDVTVILHSHSHVYKSVAIKRSRRGMTLLFFFFSRSTTKVTTP